jgi:LmbE family N-acetylglucosaminyl deacetylase
MSMPQKPQTPQTPPPPPPPPSREIAGGGTPEADWLAWPFLAAVPRLSLSDVVAPGQRLVVVAPHPDDEVLACGGLLASHAVRGGDCVVIAVTDGEASHAGSPTVVPKELAHMRRAESLQGLETLGVHGADIAHTARIVRLGVPDGQVEAHTGALISALQLILQRDDVVVGTWRLDGHPDHEATGVALAAVCAQKGCRFIEAPVWMWHWAAPGEHLVPWHRLRAFELTDEEMALKQQALAAHATQLTPRDGPNPEPVLGPVIQKRALRRTEFFFVDAAHT